MRCPCCNQPVTDPRETELAEAAARFPAHLREIMELLIRRYPHTVRHSALHDMLWGGCADGGPDDAERNVRVKVAVLRKKIALYGWAIVNDYGTGYRLERAG